MMDKKGNLRCDFCRRVIEKLDEEEALGDMSLVGHGWTDWKTAKVHACEHCALRAHPSHIPYESYIAGRVKVEGGEIRIYSPNPFGRGSCYFVRQKGVP